jgi:hypothetical protein
MLWDASGLKGYAILAKDGPLGAIIDLLFDDRGWRLRWLVGDTRYWIPHHEALLPARSLKGVDPGRQRVSVALTMDQVEASPAAETDPPGFAAERSRTAPTTRLRSASAQHRGGGRPSRTYA